MKNFKFSLRGQGKFGPVIIFQIFDSRFTGLRFMYSTGFHIQVTNWNKRQQRSNEKPINQHLDFIENAAKTFLDDRVNSRTLSRAELKEWILSRMKDERREWEEAEAWKKNELTFFKMWQHIIDTTKTIKGELIRSGTKIQKEQTLKKMQKYCVARKFEPTLLNLDINFYHDFDRWMIEKKLGTNSRGKHFKEIKSLLREAEERDMKVNQAYHKKAWKVIKTATEAVFLTVPEIKKILEVKDLPPNKEAVRDYFVMACFVGARHSDWHQIRKENIIIEDKKEIIRYKQKKTGDMVHVPLHPVVKMLLNKYKEMPKVIAAQNFNDEIKPVVQMAKLGKCVLDGVTIEKHTAVSSHTARRSFATNAYLSKSMDVQQIMKCTGHKTESSFLVYLKLDGRDFAVMASESKFFTEDWTLMKIAQ
jgi:integrase